MRQLDFRMTRHSRFDSSDFPYGFFLALIAAIGFGLSVWVVHARQQQRAAVEDCIEVKTTSEPQYTPDRIQSTCEMKCIRGELDACR